MEAVACHDFEPKDLTADPPELAFRKGDKLLILNYGDPVSWYTAQKGNQTGLVPGNYIEITKTRWYYGRIPRAYAEQLLERCKEDGSFLVRLSESSPNAFSLSVKCGDAVQHFRILRSEDSEYFLWSTRFKSLNELVEHYRHETVSRTNNIFLREMDNDSFIAVAIYDFIPEDNSEEGETELGFKKGDLIQVFDTRDDNWWGGQIGDRTGFFPKLYVKRREEEVPYKS